MIIKEYSLGKLHHSDTTTLTIKETDSMDFQIFDTDYDIENETPINFPFEIYPNDNSRILVYKIPAKFVSKKYYYENGKSLVVRKYFYDEPNTIDEEGFYFVSNNRVIAFNSVAWNLKRFYNYKDLNMENILKKDTSDFFYRHKKEILK